MSATVGQDMQAHLCADVFQRFHLQVRRAQPGFDRAEGMLDGTAANTHALRHAIFHFLQYHLMLPATYPPILSSCASRFHRAARVRRGPVPVYGFLGFVSREPID